MKVPLAAPSRMGHFERSAVLTAIEKTIDSGQLVLGPVVAEFEESFGQALCPEGVPPSVVGVASGSDALLIAIKVLRLPAGSSILVPANDGGFAANSVVAAGFIAVPVDVAEHSLIVTAETAADALVPSVTAIIVTHLHGQPADLTDLDQWRRRHGLLMIEDCAQAHGAQWSGEHVGLVGDAGTFSFYPTKNLGCLGDGGAIVFRSADLADRARQLREYGWGPRFRIDEVGGQNSRLDAVQAAVLSARLPSLSDNNERRRTIVGRYRQALTGSPTKVLGDAPGAVAHHAVVIDPQRDDLAVFLAENGISTTVHYPWLVTEMPALECATTSPLPHATASRRTKLSLPCFPAMSADELDYVCAVLERWAARHG